MSNLKMNCGYCGRKCSLEKDFCIPQDSVYICKSCYDWQNKVDKQWLQIQADTNYIQYLEKENKRLSKNLKLSRVQKENFYNNLLEKDLEKLKINLHEILFNKYGCDEKVPVFDLKIIIDDVIDYSKPYFKRRK